MTNMHLLGIRSAQTIEIIPREVLEPQRPESSKHLLHNCGRSKISTSDAFFIKLVNASWSWYRACSLPCALCKSSVRRNDAVHVTSVTSTRNASVRLTRGLHYARKANRRGSRNERNVNAKRVVSPYAVYITRVRRNDAFRASRSEQSARTLLLTDLETLPVQTGRNRLRSY